MILPPYARLLGLHVDFAADGSPIVAMPFATDVIGRPGFLHGGAIGGLLEMTAAIALRHALDDDAIAVKPINLTTDYMRGGRERTTYAAGIVTRLGNRIANVEAVAWQDDRDRPIAAARVNYLIHR